MQSTRIEVQLFRRGAGGWPSDPEVAVARGGVHLASIELDLAIEEIYRQSALS